MIYPDPEKGGRGKKSSAINSAETAGFSARRLQEARAVLRHSEAPAEDVLAGHTSLDAAASGLVIREPSRCALRFLLAALDARCESMNMSDPIRLTMPLPPDLAARLAAAAAAQDRSRAGVVRNALRAVLTNSPDSATGALSARVAPVARPACSPVGRGSATGDGRDEGSSRASPASAFSATTGESL